MNKKERRKANIEKEHEGRILHISNMHLGLDDRNYLRDVKNGQLKAPDDIFIAFSPDNTMCCIFMDNVRHLRKDTNMPDNLKSILLFACTHGFRHVSLMEWDNPEIQLVKPINNPELNQFDLYGNPVTYSEAVPEK